MTMSILATLPTPAKSKSSAKDSAASGGEGVDFAALMAASPKGKAKATHPAGHVVPPVSPVPLSDVADMADDAQDNGATGGTATGMTEMMMVEQEAGTPSVGDAAMAPAMAAVVAALAALPRSDGARGAEAAAQAADRAGVVRDAAVSLVATAREVTGQMMPDETASAAKGAVDPAVPSGSGVTAGDAASLAARLSALMQARGDGGQAPSATVSLASSGTTQAQVTVATPVTGQLLVSVPAAPALAAATSAEPASAEQVPPAPATTPASGGSTSVAPGGIVLASVAGNATGPGTGSGTGNGAGSGQDSGTARRERTDTAREPRRAEHQGATPPAFAIPTGQTSVSGGVTGATGAPMLAQALDAQSVAMGVSGQWIDTIAQQIATVAGSNGQGSFRIASSELGMVTVAITPGDAGASVHMSVDNEAAASALMAEGDRLIADARLSSVRIADLRVDQVAPAAEAAATGDMGQQQSGTSGGQPQSGGASGTSAQGQGQGQGQQRATTAFGDFGAGAGGNSREQPKSRAETVVTPLGSRADAPGDDTADPRRARYA